MTVGLLTSSRHCTRLYRKCVRKSRTDVAYKTYTKYRNTYNILKRTAKQTYYAQLFAKYKNDIRNTWKTINDIIGINNDKTRQVFDNYRNRTVENYTGGNLRVLVYQ